MAEPWGLLILLGVAAVLCGLVALIVSLIALKRIRGFLATGLALVGVLYLYQYLKKMGYFETIRPDDNAPAQCGREVDDA